MPISVFNRELKDMREERYNQGKILLVLLPVWDPLIPPLGISSLKSYIKKHGWNVITVDVNFVPGLSGLSSEYFSILGKYIPLDKRRHLYNIGHEVLRNHMMAHINLDNAREKEYIELVKVLAAKTFFHDLEESQVLELNKVIRNFYLKLEKYFIDLLDKEKPAVLGLSVYSGTLPASLFVFRLAKEKYPHIQTVMGGGIFSAELGIDSPNFKYFLEKTSCIDKIIVGEGEILFLKLLRGELSGSQKVYTINDLNGESLDITTLDEPDFSDFDLQNYAQVASSTSRSCPFQCAFCVETVYWGQFRKKTTKQIANELEYLYKTYNRRLFLMCDSLLNPVIRDLAAEMIKREVSLYWGGYLRGGKYVDDIQETMKWRQGGFYRARLGVESGSPKILDLMGKKISVAQLKSSIASLAYAGIKTTTMFVIGYPEETEEDFQQTLDLIEECKDDIYEADCNPFWYFSTGQVNSDKWQQMNKSVLLYPESARDMLIIQTWCLDCQPPREEIYRRVNRFIQHCKKLKVPNPYSLFETNEADERWKKLHKNAVPALIDINSGRVPPDECKKLSNLSFAEIKQDDGAWNF